MRKLVAIFGVAGLLLSVAAIGLADPPAKNDKKDDTKDKISQMAEQIFNRADRHNHGYLNKIEFKKADNDLATTIGHMNMAELKQLAGDTSTWHRGPPQQDGGDAKANASQFVRGFVSADSDHDKKVTLAEFTDYTSRALKAADQALSAQLAAAARAAAASAAGHGGGGRR